MALDSKLYHRVSLAILKARRLFPGPVGEMISVELSAWRDYGYWIGGQSMYSKLIDFIEEAELPSTSTDTTKKEDEAQNV
jgi:hypothetical protein